MFAAHKKADMVLKTRKKQKSEIKKRRCLILIVLHFINYSPVEIQKTSFCILASQGKIVIRRSETVSISFL